MFETGDLHFSVFRLTVVSTANLYQLQYVR